MRSRGSHILNYILSAIFLLSFSLKDLHPILFHHHVEEICDETREHFHDLDFEQECFLCDLYFSINGTAIEPIVTIGPQPVVVLEVIPVSDDHTNSFTRYLPARAPPQV